MTIFMTILVGVLILGGVYTLISLGFVYIFRATGLVNFAHGEFLLLGAWLAFTASRDWSIPAIPSLLIAVALTGGIAAVVYRLAIQPVEKHGLFVGVIATLGIASVLDGLTPLIWGNQPEALNLAPGGRLMLPGGVSITWADVCVVLISLALYALMLYIDNGTMLGVRLRACTSSQLMAANVGIRVGPIFALAWGIAAALAAAAGVAYASTNILSSDMVQQGLAGLPAALIGGFDSLKGTLPGALVCAIIVTLVSTYGSALAAMPVTYLALLAVIMVRPRGMFGTATIQRV